jgi:hypothetical protein
MTEKRDLRRHSRMVKSTPVQLAWVDPAGNSRTEKASCIDVSEAGMRVEAPRAIEKGTYVTVQASELALHGATSVRSCARKGSNYVLGLSFTGGLTWKPKP